jgi:hypothetical protein
MNIVTALEWLESSLSPDEKMTWVLAAAEA